MYGYSNGIESSGMQGWLLIQAHLINVVSVGPNWYQVETERVYGVKASKLEFEGFLDSLLCFWSGILSIKYPSANAHVYVHTAHVHV